MSYEKELAKRSNNQCELCGAHENGKTWLLPHSPAQGLEQHLWLCSDCIQQSEHPEQAEEIRWRMLNDTIWSENPAVQVLSWRMLHRLKQFDWARDLLDICYLDEDTLAWARAAGDDVAPEDQVKHLDCFGAELKHGDAVVLTKSLDVKGATFTAKVGTVVRNIKLVHDNPEQIEGRVNNSMIVILTKYVRKSSTSE